jgi:hypothetical protein
VLDVVLERSQCAVLTDMHVDDLPARSTKIVVGMPSITASEESWVEELW